VVDINITVTVPEYVLNSNFVRWLIVRAMQSKTAPDLRRLFGKTVEGWSGKPNFLQKFTNSTAYVSTTVWPSQGNKEGKTYTLVNNGSSPHRIYPRRGGMLRFQPGYRAGTRPRVLSSRSYSRSGPFVSARAVDHPGFEPREFDAEIAEQYAETFVKDMQEVIGSAARRQGT